MSEMNCIKNGSHLFEKSAKQLHLLSVFIAVHQWCETMSWLREKVHHWHKLNFIMYKVTDELERRREVTKK